MKFQRLKWNSPWMYLGVPGAIFGVWLLAHQLRNGFSAIPTLIGLSLIGCLGIIVLYCLETVAITELAVVLALGPVVLRRIPKDEIRMVVSGTISIGKGNSCCESLVFLSTKTAEQITKPLRKPSRKALCAYLESKMILHFLQPQEGLWLYYSDSRAEQIAKMLPNAENYLMNHERS